MDNKIKFATLNENGQETNIRYLSQSDIAKCPHYIFATEHYNTNGICKCNEANNKDMKKWGYKWNGSEWK